MNKTTTARSLYGAKHLGVFDQWEPCSGAGLRAHRSIRGQGHNLRRRRFGEKTHFLFIFSFCCTSSAYPFFLLGWHKASQPGRQEVGFLRQDILSCFPPFRAAFPVLWPTFSFSLLFFAFLDTNGSDALCLFSSLVYGRDLRAVPARHGVC